MIYGYARVSTEAQDLTGSTAQLKAAGCQKIFCDKITGTTADSFWTLDRASAMFERLMSLCGTVVPLRSSGSTLGATPPSNDFGASPKKRSRGTALGHLRLCPPVSGAAGQPQEADSRTRSS